MGWLSSLPHSDGLRKLGDHSAVLPAARLRWARFGPRGRVNAQNGRRVGHDARVNSAEPCLRA